MTSKLKFLKSFKSQNLLMKNCERKNLSTISIFTMLDFKCWSFQNSNYFHEFQLSWSYNFLATGKMMKYYISFDVFFSALAVTATQCIHQRNSIYILLSTSVSVNFDGIFILILLINSLIWVLKNRLIMRNCKKVFKLKMFRNIAATEELNSLKTALPWLL